MATVERFEDLIVWQKARELHRQILRIDFGFNFKLAGQATSAASSVMLNISEGFGKRTDLEFAQALNHARGSVTEVEGALYAALDAGYINVTQFNSMFGLCMEISKMTLALSRYLRKGTRQTL